MSDSRRERIVRALTEETSPLRADGAARLVDFILALPLGQLVDVTTVRPLVMQALSQENLSRINARHLKPGWERYAAVAMRSETRVGELVPEPVQLRIQELVATTPPPRAEWSTHAVDRPAIRKLLSPVFAQVLLAFARRLPIPGMGSASSDSSARSASSSGPTLAERLTRGVQKRTERFVEVGRSAMGGLGAELEKRLQTAAKDFGETAQELFKEALAERLKSEEGRALVRQISEHAIRAIMRTPLRALQEDADRFPVAAVLDLVPDIVAQAAPHDFVQQIVSGELEAFLSGEAARSVHDVLAELGILEEAKRALTAHVDGLTRRFFESAGFGDWLDRVLEL